MLRSAPSLPARRTAGRPKGLFSPKVAVSSAKSYSVGSYLNVTALATNEIGYYIDEYNSTGRWISGQYKTGVSLLGPGTVSVSDTPSSANVVSASLQVILVGGSGAHAYLDDALWYQE